MKKGVFLTASIMAVTALSAYAETSHTEFQFPDGSVWTIDATYSFGLDGKPHGRSVVTITDHNGNTISWVVTFSDKNVNPVDDFGREMLIQYPTVAPTILDWAQSLTN